MNIPNDDNLVSSNINVHTLQHIQSSLDINNTDINHTKYDKAYDEETVEYDKAYDEETVTPDDDEGMKMNEYFKKEEEEDIRKHAAKADKVVSANQPDEEKTSSDDEDELLGQLIYNSSLTAQLRREQRHAKVEEEEEELAQEQHTATVTIANPPKTHDKPSSYNDEVRKRKSLSDSSDKEMESAPHTKKKRVQKSFEQRMDELRAYKEKHRHVIHVKLSDDDKSLYNFCRNMRQGSKEMESTSKKKRRENKSFAQRIEDLMAYKEKHGHVNVKQSDNKSLYDFCRKIRHARKHPEAGRRNLTTKDIVSLDALGFEWTARNHVAKKSFDQRIEYLKCIQREAWAYQCLNDSDQPSSYEPRSEVRKRKSFSNISSKEMASAPPKKKKRATKKSFAQRMDDLRAYKEKQGHVNVSQKEDRSLYDFCRMIRYARNNPEKPVAVTDDRISSLDALGFEWSSNRTNSDIEQFAQRIDDLKAYKEKHGHVNVKWNEDNDRIARLDALGFDWTAREHFVKKSFNQRIEDLQVNKEKHGHINVKQKEDKRLYDFCCNVRWARKHPEKSTVALTDDHIASLDALGFDWRATAKAASVMNDSNQSPTSYKLHSEVRKRKSLSNSNSKEIESAPKKKRVTKKSFEQRIDDLRAYKEKHGHINVKVKEDKSLYQFCVDMRQARNNPEKSTTLIINDKRISSLDGLGFDWVVRERRAKSFEQRLADLRSYKEKHGHINVKNSEDRSLYIFCNNIRQARKNPEKSKMIITNSRISSLSALGFDWTVKEYAAKKSFEQRIEDLRAYEHKHGHMRVKKSEDKSLNKFCVDMRYAHNNPEKSNRLINEERIASLDTLGFDWRMSLG